MICNLNKADSDRKLVTKNEVLQGNIVMEYNSIILEDDFNDEIHDSIKVLKALTIRNKTKINLKAKLISLLKANGYIFFESNYTHHVTSRVFESYLYNVPVNKRGHLSPFRRKKVRIICTESGSHFRRGYMAGVIQESPPNKHISSID